jgi:restriction system protein
MTKTNNRDTMTDHIDSKTVKRSIKPGVPTYQKVRRLLKVLDGVDYNVLRCMFDRLRELRGSPQETENWTNPDEWIPVKLTGSEQALALDIWNGSGQELNPRHLHDPYYFSTKQGLLERTSGGRLSVTDRGRSFLDPTTGAEVMAIMDAEEGLLFLLQTLAEIGSGKRADILPRFSEYCLTQTTLESENVIKGALYDRMLNLVNRGLVERNGQVYEITEFGLSYLQRSLSQIPGELRNPKQSELERLAQEMRKGARADLGAFLGDMDPFKFEELIHLLLEEMGYMNVVTTSPTNDKGVDVIADIQMGISSVREVVQAKRFKGVVNRKVLDELRGSLHRFKAFRGTIITTGSFSSGAKNASFEAGAAPITLIDGEKLLDLLIEYGIGIRKKAVEYFEFDRAGITDFMEGTTGVLEK